MVLVRIWTKDQRRRAKEQAFNEHAQRVLAAPDEHSGLKLARTELGLTQAELGSIPSVSLHKGSISALESGRRAGTKNTKLRLAYALNRPVEELFPT
jgi:DNA-binding XRE family transcriptional regulator